MNKKANRAEPRVSTHKPTGAPNNDKAGQSLFRPFYLTSKSLEAIPRESANDATLLITTKPDPAPQRKLTKRAQNRTSWARRNTQKRKTSRQRVAYKGENGRTRKAVTTFLPQPKKGLRVAVRTIQLTCIHCLHVTLQRENSAAPADDDPKSG